MRRLDVLRRWIVALSIACALTATVSLPLAGAGNPSLLFSTPITGGQPVRIASDAQGFIYLAGTVAASPGAAFVMKLTPAGTPVYTTYFQGTRFNGDYPDCLLQIADIAADATGAAYVTGCTTAIDFPLANPFRSTPQGTRGSAFVAKLSPIGTLVYSTYFGSGGRDEGTGIAADDQGNAYVVGIAEGGTLPLVNPAHATGRGFAAKFDPTGQRLLYSTYLGASPRAVTIDRAGAAYIVGGGDARLPAVRPIQACHEEPDSDAVLIKLIATGRSYDYATCLGGSKTDGAASVAVDAGGHAYVVGTTTSKDFPTARAIDPSGRTGPLWKTQDGGRTWNNLSLDAYSVTTLTSPRSATGTWYAGALYGGFKSTDDGALWRRLGLPLRYSKYEPSVSRLAADPRTPSTVYASTSEGLFKSLDGGEGWTAIGASLPFGGAYLRGIAVDAADSRVIYAASQRGFWRSIDGGATWTPGNRGLGTDPYMSVLSVGQSGTLYADVFAAGVDRIFTSRDGGLTWTATPLAIARRLPSALVAVRSRHRAGGPRTRPLDDAAPDDRVDTVYAAATQVFSDGPFGVLFRSDDGGDSWESIGSGLPDRGADALAVAPADPRIVYAASRGVVFVSTNRGDTFEPLPSATSFGWATTLGIDRLRASTLFVGTSARSDAFVVRISADGGSLEYSTYLGGTADDRAARVIVDELGRAITVGSTESGDFPSVGPLQPPRGEGDGFVSEVDSGGSVLLFSTPVGGTRADRLASIVRAGRIVLISGGSYDLASMFPGSGASGAGAFVAAIDVSSGPAPFRPAR